MKQLIIRRLIGMLLPVFISTVIPFILQGKPAIQWTWSNLGPVIVDAINESK